MQNDYKSEVLSEDHKDVVMDMISRSFADKGDLTTLANVEYDHIKSQMEALWTATLAANLSLVVKNKKDELIGACINFDARADEAAPLCATAAFARNMSEEERREGKCWHELFLFYRVFKREDLKIGLYFTQGSQIVLLLQITTFSTFKTKPNLQVKAKKTVCITSKLLLFSIFFFDFTCKGSTKG